MIRTTIAIAALMVSTTVDAARRAVLNNDAGGKIVLTFNEVASCPKGLMAYTTSPNLPTLRGCWVSDGVMVHIEWSDEPGEVRSYDINDFEMVGSE